MKQRTRRAAAIYLLGLVSAGSHIASAPAQSERFNYILCETKTGNAYQWFFSSIFTASTEVRQSTLQNAFTNYVIRNYRDQTNGNAIGPADCYIDRSRSDAEYHHSSMRQWATSNGNSVVETSWTYPE